jgi:hypothetical protein
MRFLRRTQSDWDDPIEVTLEGVVEDHDADLGEQGRAIDANTALIDQLRKRVVDLETAYGALFDYLAEQRARELDGDFLDWFASDFNSYDIMDTSPASTSWIRSRRPRQ